MGEKQRNNKSNIFYAIIGILTFMVAVVGATFAYFTATASNNVITGNMATIDFDLSVAKVTKADDDKGGLIPMSNNMMEAALGSSKGICVDDNGNAVCQVYKITVENKSSASMFLDGYVTLTGGSGSPQDYLAASYKNATEPTTMRWAQAFCSAENGEGVVTSCTTAGSSTTRTSDSVTYSVLGSSTAAKADGYNKAEILDALTGVSAEKTINKSSYRILTTNYIRVSDHTTNSTAYDRTKDVTSALVYSQYLEKDDKSAANNTGTSVTSFSDAQVYYIVVWLSETGYNQTTGATGAAASANNFYRGNVTFVSAQGSEVTAAFTGSLRVTPNTTQAS